MKRKLKRILVNQGLEGIPQTKLIRKLRTYNVNTNPNGIKGEDVREVLEDWRIKQLVQVFKKQEGLAKKPSLIWRATKLIETYQV